ncbi:MAG: hypothetical protein ACT4NV_09210 [Rhodoferax sp.]
MTDHGMGGCWAIILVLVASLGSFAKPTAALAEERQEEKQVAHYVRLLGHSGNSERERLSLLEMHKSCSLLRGTAATPLPPEGVPAIPQPVEIEIYYGPDRTLTINRGKIHAVRMEDCSLVEIPHHFRELHTRNEACSIDMLKEEARGICDGNGEKLNGSSAMRIRPRLQAIPAPMRSKTEDSKIIAGHRCDIYHNKLIGYKFCMANPKTAFEIPVAPLNGGIPGILLEANNPVMTLQAEEVALEMQVSSELFRIPPGVRAGRLSQRAP